MSLTTKIRQKRFQLKPDADLHLITENEQGEQAKYAINNLSLMGLSVHKPLDKSTPKMTYGEILQASKIVGPEIEVPLGRLVFRHEKSELNLLGFSCVDSKIPVSGLLSKFVKGLDIEPYGLELNSTKFTLGEFAFAEANGKDILEKCRSFHIMSQEWKKKPGYQYKTIRSRSKGSRVSIKGCKRDAIIMGSNDYLGLAAHPRVIEAVIKTTSEYGFGSTGSPLTTGQSDIHEELCQFLARFLQKENVVLFNSGYAANIGIISGIARSGDLILADFFSHASIQDAMKMSPATSRFFRHNNPDHLREILKAKRNNHSGCLIITEGVFSMDGDVPPLQQITELAKEYDCRILIDEAHSIGVIGDRGQGAALDLNQGENADMIMGTFSKCFGGIGGFVAASQEVTDWLYWFARAHMFSVSIPPGTAAAVLEAGKIITEDPSLLRNLKGNIHYFVSGLREMGIQLHPEHQSAVIPVIIRDEEKMGIMNRHLIEHGIFVVPIIYPAVKRNECRFRFTVMATHTKSDLDFVLKIFAESAELAGVIFDDT